MEGSRLFQLYSSFTDSGFTALYTDQSVVIRLDAIFNAILDSFHNYFMPLGYELRIGSGLGAVLHELGIFGIAVLFYVPFLLSHVFKKKPTRVASFIVIFFMLFSNTQLANPLMLFVIGVNMYYAHRKNTGASIITGKRPRNDWRIPPYDIHHNSEAS